MKRRDYNAFAPLGESESGQLMHLVDAITGWLRHHRLPTGRVVSRAVLGEIQYVFAKLTREHSAGWTAFDDLSPRERQRARKLNRLSGEACWRLEETRNLLWRRVPERDRAPVRKAVDERLDNSQFLYEAFTDWVKTGDPDKLRAAFAGNIIGGPPWRSPV